MASLAASKLAKSTGLNSVKQAPRDAKILFLQRFVRLFAYGASTIVLANFLSLLGASESRIGLFMTLTLLGDVVLSFLLTIFADGLGRRKVLIQGAALMIMSGVVFVFSSNFWVLVVASVFGVISPSGTEIGPFRATEESTLAQLSPQEDLSDFYAWYALCGSAGSAFGTLIAGGLVSSLQTYAGWSELSSQRSVFFLYALLGALKLALSLALSPACEPEPTREDITYHSLDEEQGDDDPDPPVKVQGPPSRTERIRKLLPKISESSRPIIFRICVLFALDSFASGLVNESWMTYFFIENFGLKADVLGTLFFVSNIVSSASNLVAASLSKQIGLIRTMVYTHLPSSIFLSLIPFPPQASLSALFMILRRCTSQMDQAPRQAFLSAVILPNERTAVMGATNVVKTLAQSAGPVLTGYLAQNGKFWAAFITAGILKASYDLIMLKMFSGTKV